MAGFTSEALEKKLLELNNSQQSIQTLSLWLIHHRKHHKAIVQTWYTELRKARQNRKLTFMYLANDVIQNSRKKGPEFAKEFGNALKHAFGNVARESDEKTWIGLDRILSVWSERNIYDATQMSDFKKAMGNQKTAESGKAREPYKSKASGEKPKPKPASRPSSEYKVKREKDKDKEKQVAAKKRKTGLNTSSNIVAKPAPQPGAIITKKASSAPKAVLVVEKMNAGKSLKSPTPPTNGEAVEPDTLVKALQDLESCASSDAGVREKIASLPPEVSDASLLDKIRDKGAAERLSKQVDEACSLLADYNSRLSQELEDRKQVSSMLSNYIKNQREVLSLSEQKLSEYKDKLRKVTQVRNELKSHLQNLPDLSLLPSVTGGLAPLPSAGDLFTSFNIAAARAASMKSSMGSTSSASPNTASPADYETVSTGTPNSGS